MCACVCVPLDDIVTRITGIRMANSIQRKYFCVHFSIAAWLLKLVVVFVANHRALQHFMSSTAERRGDKHANTTIFESEIRMNMNEEGVRYSD